MKIESFQNIVDVCVQEYGSADALVSFCKLNALGLDAELASGTEVKTGQPIRKSVRDFLKQRLKGVLTGRDADAGLALPLILSEDDLFFMADEVTGQAILQQ